MVAKILSLDEAEEEERRLLSGCIIVQHETNCERKLRG